MLAQVGKFFCSTTRFKTPDSMPDQQQAIIHMTQPDLPRYRFEWHRKAQRVYVIDIVQGEQTLAPIGHPIAYHIDTEGAANNAMLTWKRGYLVGKEQRTHNDQGKIVLIGDHS